MSPECRRDAAKRARAQAAPHADQKSQDQLDLQTCHRVRSRLDSSAGAVADDCYREDRSGDIPILDVAVLDFFCSRPMTLLQPSMAIAAITMRRGRRASLLALRRQFCPDSGAEGVFVIATVVREISRYHQNDRGQKTCFGDGTSARTLGNGGMRQNQSFACHGSTEANRPKPSLSRLGLAAYSD